MRLSRIKSFVSILVVLLFLGFGYYYRENIVRLSQGEKPCQKPITYSISSFDPLFGLTKEELLVSIEKAEKIWEKPINKQLFEYSLAGDLKINFIYDYRQKATDALKKIGIVLNDDKATYNLLKDRYDLLVSSYNKEKAQLELLIADYNAAKSAYEKDVKYWNNRGGATKEEYNILEQKRADLNNQVVIINQAQNSLNGLVENINSTGLLLNKLIVELNLQVGTYNEVGSSTGKQFMEGQYAKDANGEAINIYQFNDANQLVRVLAHEFGHALGIGHLDNPKAIMYYLNEGINEKLTPDDLVSLKNVCGIK